MANAKRDISDVAASRRRAGVDFQFCAEMQEGGAKKKEKSALVCSPCAAMKNSAIRGSGALLCRSRD